MSTRPTVSGPSRVQLLSCVPWAMEPGPGVLSWPTSRGPSRARPSVPESAQAWLALAHTNRLVLRLVSASLLLQPVLPGGGDAGISEWRERNEPTSEKLRGVLVIFYFPCLDEREFVLL